MPGLDLKMKYDQDLCKNHPTLETVRIIRIICKQIVQYRMHCKKPGNYLMIVKWSRFHYLHSTCLSTILLNVKTNCFDIKVHLPGPETCSQLLESVTDAMLRFCWSSAVQQNAPRANFKCIFQTSRVNVQLTTNHSNGPMLDRLAGTLIYLLIKSVNVCTDLSITLNPLTHSIFIFILALIATTTLTKSWQ